MRNILAVGAYERDNFGDYLFLEVLKRALPQDNIIPSSVMYADMRSEYGAVVLPYDFILAREKVDGVWVVGGEVGAVGVVGALGMSMPTVGGAQVYSDDLSHEDAARIEHLVGANRDNHQAYIPLLDLYEKNQNATLVLNSVGLSFARKNDWSKLPLTRAARITVRESSSLRWCKDLSIPASTGPDVVQALADLYTPKKNASGLVFHANKKFIEETGIRNVVQALAAVYRPTDGQITIIAAGIANGHDAPAQLETIAQSLNRQGIPASFRKTREPLELVDIIAGATLTISTSLHVRIVSSAFSIQRVSLANQKVATYVSDWDKEFPADVPLEDLPRAVDSARAAIPDKSHAKRLSSAALNDIEKSARLIKHDAGGMLDIKELERDYLAYMNLEAIAMVAGLQRHDNNLQKQLDGIHRSKAWKLIRRLRALRKTMYSLRRRNDGKK